MADRMVFIDTLPIADAFEGHQIELPKTASAATIVQRVRAVVKSELRHGNVRIVFRAQGPRAEKYVQMVVEFSGGSADLKLTNNALNAAARFFRSSEERVVLRQAAVAHTRVSDDAAKRARQEAVTRAVRVSDAAKRVRQVAVAHSRVSDAAKRAFVLDQISNVDGNDLRDDATGRVDAKKVAALFSIRTPSIAKAAGISPQALNANPLSPKAQRVLKLFERIARLRSYPQFKNPEDLRKWFRQSYPLFSGHSAEDLFKAGKLDVVATKVDEMLTGDFGG